MLFFYMTHKNDGILYSSLVPTSFHLFHLIFCDSCVQEWPNYYLYFQKGVLKLFSIIHRYLEIHSKVGDGGVGFSTKGKGWFLNKKSVR